MTVRPSRGLRRPHRPGDLEALSGPDWIGDIDRLLATEHGLHEGSRKHLGTPLSQLVDCAAMYPAPKTTATAWPTSPSTIVSGHGKLTIGGHESDRRRPAAPNVTSSTAWSSPDHLAAAATSTSTSSVLVAPPTTAKAASRQFSLPTKAISPSPAARPPRKPFTPRKRSMPPTQHHAKEPPLRVALHGYPLKTFAKAFFRSMFRIRPLWWS